MSRGMKLPCIRDELDEEGGELARWQNVGERKNEKGGGEEENSPQWGGPRMSKNRNPSAQVDTIVCFHTGAKEF